MKTVVKCTINPMLVDLSNKDARQDVKMCLRDALRHTFINCSLSLLDSACDEIVILLETKKDICAEDIERCKNMFFAYLNLDADFDKINLTFSEYKEAKPLKTELTVTEKINKLIGAEQFKAFAEEINNIAGFYKDADTLKDILLGMSYLLAVNPCDGRKTVATLLSDLIGEKLGYKSVKLTRCSIKTLSNENNGEEEGIIKTVSAPAYEKDVLPVVFISIDDAYSVVNNEKFKHIVSAAWRASGDKLFIFAIPYLEPSVVKEVHAKISDAFCSRLISISPFTNDMYIKYFSLYCSKYSMALSEDANDALAEKIVEEKSDGSFFGFKTIEKICTEILYHKAKASAEGDTFVISKEDVLRVLPKKDQPTGKTGLELLDEMVGLDEVKRKINEILVNIKYNKQSKSAKKRSMTMHMMFSGGPGTGKTQVARLIGQIFKEEKVLSKGGFYEVNRDDLVGRFVGHTAPKTISVCKSAYGSVLFIDEAYALNSNDDKDYGKEAIGALIAEMENNRDNLVVIFAGYDKDLEKLMALNPGLKDRIPYHINFTNYTRKELKEIFYTLLDKDFKHDNEFKKAVNSYFEKLPKEIMENESFSNARFVRNLAERVLSKAVLRMDMDGFSTPCVFTKSDFTLAADEFYSDDLNKKTKARTVGFVV